MDRRLLLRVFMHLCGDFRFTNWEVQEIEVDTTWTLNNLVYVHLCGDFRFTNWEVQEIEIDTTWTLNNLVYVVN